MEKLLVIALFWILEFVEFISWRKSVRSLGRGDPGLSHCRVCSPVDKFSVRSLFEQVPSGCLASPQLYTVHCSDGSVH